MPYILKKAHIQTLKITFDSRPKKYLENFLKLKGIRIIVCKKIRFQCGIFFLRTKLTILGLTANEKEEYKQNNAHNF